MGVTSMDLAIVSSISVFKSLMESHRYIVSKRGKKNYPKLKELYTIANLVEEFASIGSGEGGTKEFHSRFR